MSLLSVPVDGDRLEWLLQQACFHLDRRQPCVCVPAITTITATIHCGFSPHTQFFHCRMQATVFSNAVVRCHYDHESLIADTRALPYRTVSNNMCKKESLDSFLHKNT